MSRKSVNVEVVKTKINQVLALSECSSDMRQGMMNVLEDILHTSGNYHGFRYLGNLEVPRGQYPGIHMELIDSRDHEAKFFGTDRTRVQYF